jgi:diguanylate cyclase (GGDEF)-like protein/PAS domain S-box-containing protein
LREITRSGMEIKSQRVQTRPQLEDALLQFAPDVILCDFSLPRFSGAEALAIAKEKAPETPFIFVSGTIGEERAIEAIRLGATDYILKDNLRRLVPAVNRALQETRARAQHRMAEAALQQTEERFRSFMQHLPGIASVVDIAGRYIYVNDNWLAAFGKKKVDVISRTRDEVWPAERARSLKSLDQQVIETGQPVRQVFSVDEGNQWWLSHHFPIPDENGRTVLVGTIALDVTEQKLQEEKIARLSRIHAVLSGINSAIVRIRDRHELFQEACRIAVEHGKFGLAWIGRYDAKTLDITPEAWAGIGTEEHLRSKATARPDVPAGQGVLGTAIRSARAVFDNDISRRTGVGGKRREEALRLGYRSLIALPLFEQQSVVGCLAMFARQPDFFTDEEVRLLTDLANDISFALEYIGKDEKLNYLAYYDPLTGAANHDLLQDRLTQAIVHARRYGVGVAVAVLNLDHFKLINDTLGHHAGDQLLKHCVKRIRACVRDTDTLARLGGDEFVLVLPDQTDAPATYRVVRRVADALSTAPHIFETLQRVMNSISEPVIVEDNEVNVTCSIGVSLYPQDGNDAGALIRNAMAALSRSKELGRKNYQFYTPEINARVAERLSLHLALRHALERNEFSLHYQPKINLETGELVGCEALLRWHKAGTEPVSPAVFVPVLEETGYIIDVGRWVIEKAVSTYRQWQAQQPHPPKIAVNVSQLQLAQKDFAAVVESIIRSGEQRSTGIALEITESLIMHDMEANVAKLTAIRRMGLEIAIDDFGTGHSSLNYLARLPVNILKIDRAFITDMEHSREGLAIVTSVISLAHSLGLKVVAEGVETESQIKMLSGLKCDEIQGYAICRPLPEADFQAWCASHAARRRKSP